MFADQVGIADYQDVVLKSRSEDALGDWTFAHIAFPEFPPDNNAYFKLIRSRSWLFRRIPPDHFKSLAFALRESAKIFISRLVNEILARNPAIVGCSSTFCQHVASLALLRRVKELAPHVVTLLGGANCETVMGKVSHQSFPWVDYVVSGEADDLIAPLTRAILKHGRDIDPADLPEGVFAPVHRHAGYPSIGNGSLDDLPRAGLQSLEDRPLPNYDDYFRTLSESSNLRDIVKPGITVETSRGCWWGHRKGCTFCGLNGRGKTYRVKPAEQALREFELLRERYHVNRIEVVDNIMDMRYLKTLIPRLKFVRPPYSLFYETKSNLKKRHIREMRQAGILWIQPGIESLHSKVLALMNKGCEAWRNVQLLKWCRQFGMRVVWSLLYDFPGEQDAWYDEMAQMAPLLAHLNPPAGLVPIRYDRYSHYHENAERYGLKLIPAEPYSYVYPVAPKDLNDLVYFFDEEGRENVRASEVLTILLLRQGIENLRRERVRWATDFWSGNRPVLSMKVSSDEVIIRDTRPIAVESSYVLGAAEREMFLACDQAPSLAAVVRSLMENGFTHAEIEVARTSLLERKLLLEIDGRLLALAVREPVPELPSPEEFPGGFVDLAQCNTASEKATA
jgi:ribosomal peptide maturation radical SAM protein 1